MRRVRYPVAASLDGYIAGPNGEVAVTPVLLGGVPARPSRTPHCLTA
jgi:hypothetical protein